jgi:hypothetical protein
MKAWPHRMIAALAVALSFSAVLVGSTQAADRPDNRSGVRGIDSQNTGTSDVFTRAVARAHAVRAVRPDDRAGLRGSGAAVAGPAPLATTVSTGFHWADAGFGAAAALALVFILAGLVAARASQRRTQAILD